MALVFLGYIGAAQLRVVLAAGTDTWTVSFIALPMAVIIFMASLRYALGRDGTTISRWLSEVTEVARDWMPFLLLLLFYVTFQSRLFQSIQPRTLDTRLLAIDRWFLGGTPSVWMQSWYTPALTNFLTLCYFLHLILPAVIAAVWYRFDKRVFRELLLAVMIAGSIASICYLFVPAVGPGVAFPQLYSRTLEGALYHPIVDVIEQARSPRDVFPSLHVAISALVLWYGWRRGRVAFLLLLPFVVGNWVSTLYLRYHYLVDVVAGFATTVLAILLARLALRLETKLQTR
jgi:membrane-associated phospholipid phosphatase